MAPFFCAHANRSHSKFGVFCFYADYISTCFKVRVNEDNEHNVVKPFLVHARLVIPINKVPLNISENVRRIYIWISIHKITG